MKRNLLVRTSAALLLCVAAWLAGRYSVTSRLAVAPHRELAPAVQSAGQNQVPEPASSHPLSIAPEALQSPAALEAWLALCLGKPEPEPKALWGYHLALQKVRMSERFRDLDDDSVRRLADFLAQPEAREHFTASQTFIDVIGHTLLELARRDRAALPAWILKATSGNEGWKYLFYYAGELTLRERMDLARQIGKSHPQTGETPEPWQSAFQSLRRGEIEEASILADSLPPERQREAFQEMVRAMAFDSGSTRHDWQKDLGPFLSRAYPEETAGELPARQVLNALFRGRLAHDETGADCAAWLETQSLSPRLHATAATELMSAWMLIDSPAAAAWRFQLAPKEDRPAVLEQIISKWAAPDGLIRAPLEARTAAAAEWLRSNVPGPEADLARAALAKSWSIIKEPEAGAAWAGAITDPDLREKTLQSTTGPAGATAGNRPWQQLVAEAIRWQK